MCDEQQNEYWHTTDNVYNYVVPAKAGDSYYIFKFLPFDANYLSIEGHFYVYGETNFGRLNLSDSGTIPYIKASYITVKAPVGMEIYTTGNLTKLLKKKTDICTTKFQKALPICFVRKEKLPDIPKT